MSVAAAILVKVIHRTNRQCVLASVPQIDVMLEQKTVGPSAGESRQDDQRRTFYSR